MNIVKDIEAFKKKYLKAAEKISKEIQQEMLNSIIDDSPDEIKDHWELSTNSSGEKATITNTHPDAEKYEYGDSEHEAHGMLRKNIAKYQRIANKIIRKNKI